MGRRSNLCIHGGSHHLGLPEVSVRFQEDLQGTACEHTPIGLKSRLHLEPVEIAIETGQQGDREAHVDDRRRLAFRATSGFMGVLVCTSSFLPPARRGTVAMSGASMDLILTRT